MKKQKEKYERERLERKKREKLERDKNDNERLDNSGSLSERKKHRKNIYNDRVREKDYNKESWKSDRNDVMKYYKSFSTKPSTFREMYETNNEQYSSSEDEYSSSSEDFPHPKSPHKKVYKRSDDDYKTMFNKINDLQKRLYHMELKSEKEFARINKRR